MSLEHLEYLKQKSVLEKPLERWEQFDWNLDAEIVAFTNRMNICNETFPVADLKRVIISRHLGKEDTAGRIDELVENVLNVILDAPDYVLQDIKQTLLEDDNIARIAKSVGFVDLMQRKNPTSEQIATQFRHGFSYFKP